MTNVKKFMKYVKPYTSTFLVLFLNSCLISGTTALLPSFISIMFQQKVYGNDRIFSAIILMILFIFIGYSLLRIINALINPYLVTGFLYNVRRDMYLSVLYTRFPVKIPSGDIQSRINNDTDSIRAFIVHHILGNLQAVIKFVFSMYFLFLLSKAFFMLALIIIPVVCWLTKKINEYYEDVAKKQSKLYGKYLGWLLDVLSGAAQIKLINAYGTITRMFSRKIRENIDIGIEMEKKKVKVQSVNTVVSFLFTACVYAMGVILVFRDQLPVGNFISIVIYFETCKGLFYNILMMPTHMKVPEAALERIFEILEMPREDYSAETNLISAGNIEIRNLSFKYDDKYVLENLNLTFRTGEKTAIIGENGSGKSTLAYLLLRFYEINEGQIYIDGVPINEISLKELRSKITIIYQDILIFEDTLRFNLVFDSKEYRDDEIIRVCELVGIKPVIENAPKGLDTIIGQNGFNLSGGERQRLAIARALLSKAKIIIFDESTSYLDEVTEALINKTLEQIKENRTIIIISHKKTIINSCDEVFSLSKKPAAAVQSSM